MFFLHQLGISLVYWLNLFKTHCVLFASTCTARRAKLYSIVYRVLSWSARKTHLRPMRFPKLALHAMCPTAQDAHIAIRQSCINNLLDFNAGLIILEKDQNDLVKIFFMIQNSSKRPNVDAVVVYGHQATIHDLKYGTTCVLFASTYTAKQNKTMYYSLN